MTMYERIKKRRLELGLTQEELAFRSGYTSRSTINKIESGQIDLTESKISAIAKSLGTTEAYLMGWENDDSYYLNPESAKIAQEAFENPELRILFDAARNVSPEDLKYVIDLLKRLEKEENPNPEDFPDEVYDDDFNQDPGDD